MPNKIENEKDNVKMRNIGTWNTRTGAPWHEGKNKQDNERRRSRDGESGTEMENREQELWSWNGTIRNRDVVSMD